jgi:hypothetical protein
MTDKELSAVIKKYEFDEHDLWLDPKSGMRLVSARGIRKIIFKDAIDIEKVFHQHGNSVVVVCRGVMTAVTTRTYTAMGEASPRNTTFPYPVSVAEKRAESRCVLNLIGLYHLGFIGSSELGAQEAEGAQTMKERKAAGKAAVEATLEMISKKK